jgi:branched-chain amino acid transport system permease protein
MVNFILTIAVFVGFQMILALGMNVVWGYAGLLNLSYFIYYAVGAYVTGTLMLNKATPPITTYIFGYHWPFALAALGGLVAAGLLATVIGSALLGSRLQPDYFPIVTLVLASASIQFISQKQNLFNGFSGLIGVRSPFPDAWGPTATSVAYVVLVFGCVLVVAVFCGILRRSGLGRQMRAVRDDQVAASAYGINIYRTKLKAHVIGGVIAAVAGSLTVVYAGAFNPSGWSIGETLVALSCVFVGGTGNNLGVMTGAAIVVVVFSEGVQLLLPYVPGIPISSNALAIGHPVALNILVLIILRFRRQGLIPEHVQNPYPSDQRRVPTPLMAGAVAVER